MTEIYLVRHGETEWSRAQRHTSVTDLDLTERGVAQAESLRGRLDVDAFDLVLCSPRRRAQRTAVLAGFGADRLEIEPDLAEWNYGQYEGRTGAQIREEHPGWRLWDGDAPPGGENGLEVRDRLARVIRRVQGSGAERVICFGHGHALRVMALTWLGIDLACGDQFPLDTGTISVLAPYRGFRALRSWNAG
jgi:probable phosphoglycerate mutase